MRTVHWTRAGRQRYSAVGYDVAAVGYDVAAVADTGAWWQQYAIKAAAIGPASRAPSCTQLSCCFHQRCSQSAITPARSLR
jgi:hypothetical protein